MKLTNSKNDNIVIINHTEIDSLLFTLSDIVETSQTGVKVLEERFPDGIVGKYLSLDHKDQEVSIKQSWGDKKTLAVIYNNG